MGKCLDVEQDTIQSHFMYNNFPMFYTQEYQCYSIIIRTYRDQQCMYIPKYNTDYFICDSSMGSNTKKCDGQIGSNTCSRQLTVVVIALDWRFRGRFQSQSVPQLFLLFHYTYILYIFKRNKKKKSLSFLLTSCIHFANGLTLSVDGYKLLRY